MKPQALPLKLNEDIGVLWDVHTRVFDFKLANSAEWKVNGTRGGMDWKGRLER